MKKLLLLTIALFSSFCFSQVPCIELAEQLNSNNKDAIITQISDCALKNGLVSVEKKISLKKTLTNRKNLDSNFIKAKLTSLSIISSFNSNPEIDKSRSVDKGRDYLSDPSLSFGTESKEKKSSTTNN